MERNQKGETTQRQKSVSDRISALFTSGDFSDVTFVVGALSNQMKFQAHSLILMTASEAFKAMFEGVLPTSVRKLEVPEIHPDGFSTMLRYVYTDEIRFDSVDNAIHTLAAANKYVLHHLRQMCSNYLAANVTPSNSCLIYETACYYKLLDLESSSKVKLLNNTEKVLNDASFLKAQMQTVKYILSSKTFTKASDLQLFNALVRWGKSNSTSASVTVSNANTNKTRAVIDHLLQYIDFTSMSAEDFASGPALSGVFTDEEVLPMLMHIVSPGHDASPLPPVFASCSLKTVVNNGRKKRAL